MIELIPAIDIIDGKCVRLTQGDYATKKVYNEDPLEVAKMFEGNGIRRLHVVDLDGAREGRIINYRILERIATRTSLIIDFGGGLKQEDDLEIAFESGAQMVTGGSIAVKNPEMFTSWIRSSVSRPEKCHAAVYALTGGAEYHPKPHVAPDAVFASEVQGRGDRLPCR